MLRFSFALALAASTLACAEEDRHVRVVVDVDEDVDVPIASVQATVTLLLSDGSTTRQQAADLPRGGSGGAIAFPADFVVLIGALSGDLAVHASGLDADGATVASGSGSATVTPGGEGRVQTVDVLLSPGSSSAGCGDGVPSPGEICYSPALAPTTERAGEAVAVDVDGDGLLDIVAAIGGETSGRGLSIALGRGGDEFDPPTTLFGPAVNNAGAAEIAVGDVNGDTLPDAVVATSVHEAPFLTLGREGDAPFGVLSPIVSAADGAVGLDPILADLDADGDLDVVARSTNAVWAALGEGDGDFVEVGRFDLTPVQAVAVGPLDADGDLEIAVGNSLGELAVLDRDLTEIDRMTVDAGVRALVVTDIDGVAPAEVVAAVDTQVRSFHLEGASLVEDSATVVTPGRGFSMAPVQLPEGQHGVAVLVDEGRDGEYVLPTVVMLVPESGRSLEVRTRERVYCWNGLLTTADFEGDGTDEMLVTCDPAGVAIVRTDGPGGELYRPLRGPFTWGVNVGSMTGDGTPDLILENWSLQLVRRANEPNAGDFPEDVPGSDGGQIDPTFADFTGDERDDLTSVCADEEDWCHDGTLNRWTANIGGAIEELPAVQLPAPPEHLTVGWMPGADKVRILVSLEDGSLVAVDGGSGELVETAHGVPTPAARLAAGRLDETVGDDVIAVGEDGTVVCLRSNGSGGFADAEEVGTTQDTSGLLVVDLDGDSYAEVVLTQGHSNNVAVLRLAGGGLEDLATFAAGVLPDFASAFDIDGNGLPELLLASSESIEVWTLAAEPRLRKTIVGFRGYGSPIVGWPLRGPDEPWEPMWLFTAGQPDLGNEDWQTYMMAIPPHP